MLHFERISPSELIPIGNISNVEILADELGCKVGCLPSTYLGLSLGACFRSATVWDGVEERFRKRLGNNTRRTIDIRPCNYQIC